MDERKQFTFYGSIYQALKRIKKASDRCAAYDIICEYALFNIEPDLDKYSDAVGIAFELIRPNLDSSRRKAASGKAGGSKPKPKPKQTESKPKESETEGGKERESEVEYEIEKENEVEVEVESEPEAATTTAAAESALVFRKGLGRGVVFLSEAQINELVELLGVDGFDYYVDKLAAFIVDRGAKVRNHYATILKWWEEDCATDIPRRRGGGR